MHVSKKDLRLVVVALEIAERDRNELARCYPTDAPEREEARADAKVFKELARKLYERSLREDER